MTRSASLSIPELSSLMDKMPIYRSYRSASEAAAAEHEFRHALGALLKECGERLLNVADSKSQILSSAMEDKIDDLVDGIEYLAGRGLVDPDRVGVTGVPVFKRVRALICQQPRIAAATPDCANFLPFPKGSSKTPLATKLCRMSSGVGP